MSPRNVEYVFDIVCPYAYLGSTQIEALCSRHNAGLSWHPVLLGGILKSIGTDPLFTTKLPHQKIRHNMRDLYRWADHFGVPYSQHPRHPLRTVTVMRSLLVNPLDVSLIHRLYRASWVENRDLDQDDVLAEVLDEAGLNGAATVAMTQDPAIKADLRQRTDQVVERGVFGVPAMFVGDQLVWGQDRLHFVETLLEGGIL